MQWGLPHGNRKNGMQLRALSTSPMLRFTALTVQTPMSAWWCVWLRNHPLGTKKGQCSLNTHLKLTTISRLMPRNLKQVQGSKEGMNALKCRTSAWYSWPNYYNVRAFRENGRPNVWLSTETAGSPNGQFQKKTHKFWPPLPTEYVTVFSGRTDAPEVRCDGQTDHSRLQNPPLRMRPRVGTMDICIKVDETCTWLVCRVGLCPKVGDGSTSWMTRRRCTSLHMLAVDSEASYAWYSDKVPVYRLKTVLSASSTMMKIGLWFFAYCPLHWRANSWTWWFSKVLKTENSSSDGSDSGELEKPNTAEWHAASKHASDLHSKCMLIHLESIC